MDGLYEFNIDVDELCENSPKAVQPENINITLKDHQLNLLHRCIHYENNDLCVSDYPIASVKFPNARIKANMAIIGDRVGSGKSYVVLSLIKANDITGKDNTIIKSYGINKVVFYIPDRKKVVKTNLIVIPHNLTVQWEDYIKRFSLDMKYKIFNRQKHIDAMQADSFNIENYDLVVVTGTFYSKVSKYINDNGIKLQRVFFDEVDNINIPGCNKVDACFTWFITASFGNVLYHRGFRKFESNTRRHICYATGLRNTGYIKDVFSDFDCNETVTRDLMKILVVKNSEAYVEKSISLPPIHNIIIKCMTPITINILNGIVDKNIIDCLSANDINGALQCINSNNKGNEDNIVRLLIDKYTRLLTNNNLNLSMINQMIFENETERNHEIESINIKIRALQVKIEAITYRITDNNVCIICYEPTTDVNTVKTVHFVSSA